MSFLHRFSELNCFENLIYINGADRRSIAKIQVGLDYNKSCLSLPTNILLFKNINIISFSSGHMAGV